MNVLTILWVVAGLVALLGFFAAFAAAIVLQFYIDHQKVRRDTGRSGAWVIGTLTAPIEWYRPEAAPMWKIKQKGFRVFFFAGGALIIIAVLAAVLGLSLDPRR